VVAGVWILINRRRRARRPNSPEPSWPTTDTEPRSKTAATTAAGEQPTIGVGMPEFDTLEQHRTVAPEESDLFATEIPLEVPEADLLDQTRAVPTDDDERPFEGQ